MDWIGLLIAGLQALAAVFGASGHVGAVCVNTPVAIHVTANSGFETSPTLRGAIIGQPPAC
jgi:hypothetical protein